jgi:hypothetical protein
MSLCESLIHTHILLLLFQQIIESMIFELASMGEGVHYRIRTNMYPRAPNGACNPVDACLDAPQREEMTLRSLSSVRLRRGPCAPTDSAGWSAEEAPDEAPTERRMEVSPAERSAEESGGGSAGSVRHAPCLRSRLVQSLPLDSLVLSDQL